MNKDLTKGNESRQLLSFAGPMIAGNLLQQVYNIADTYIVGKYVGADALAAVGSTYTLTTFLYSILIGLCMGCASLISYSFGAGKIVYMRKCIHTAMLLLGSVAVLLQLVAIIFKNPILHILQTPEEVFELTASYAEIIFVGILFIFLYNFYAFLLRAIGNTVVPLIFLGASALLNVLLDILFVAVWQMGVTSAAKATLMAQVLCGVGISIYTQWKVPLFRLKRSEMHMEKQMVKEVVRMSAASSVQQSVMNFGILMIQGLVNSFGTTVMAAFTVAVKIDTLAYMPAQEFGNAFSLFISQNFGAGKTMRIRKGIKSAAKCSLSFCIGISAAVMIFAKSLMHIFVSKPEIVQQGVTYLRIEGACYCGIGILFLLYGYYRGINRPEMSLILTIISLGTRVLLAYTLAPIAGIGTYGIWFSIPIGWVLADVAGIGYGKYLIKKQKYC